MKKIVLSIIIVITIILVSNTIISLSAEERNQLISDAEKEKEIIMAQCIEDPYNCDCEIIPCDQILSSENPEAKTAYRRCLQEVELCKSELKKGLEEMEKQKKKIEAECRKDFSRCDCSHIRSNKGRHECQLAVAQARKDAQEEMEKQKKKIEAKCRKDLSSCSCDTIENEAGKKECDNAIIEAKYQAQKEKNEMIKKCTEDLNKCNCDLIENEAGKEECKSKKKEAEELKSRIKESCKINPMICDCSEIENEAGKEECEREKKKGFEEASNKIKTALSRCFKDVDKCDCSNIGIPEEHEEGIEFCEVQKHYGLSCKYEGLYCEKLEAVEIYPPGMPPWLGTIFAKEYSYFIEKEKEKGTKEAGRIITGCINKPESCECEKTPTYAKAFCEKMKELQLRCYNEEDYSACMLLEDSKNLPDEMPYFMTGILDKMVQSLREAQEKMTKGKASKKVGDMILNCIDDTSLCDCSMSPTGNIRSFCQHKIDLVKKCKDNKDLDACFTLDEEPIVDDSIPEFVQSYIHKNVEPKILIKKTEMFNEMKKNTVCEEAETIPDCRIIYKKEIIDKI